jgi:hypothetical protein
MRACVMEFVFAVSLLVSVNGLAWQDVPGGPDPSTGTDASAIDLVQQALQAEAENNAARRDMLLGEALRKDPECAPARWHAGFVRLDDHWLALAEAQSRFAADSHLAEYRQVRASLAESPLRELLLARWCDEKKLADEGRFHWLNVLRIEPLNQEALNALGVQWHNGLLLTRDQVAEQKRKDFQASRDTVSSSVSRKHRLETTIASWEHAADRGDSNLLATMAADLAAEKSRNAIPMINVLLNQRGRSPRNPASFQAVSLNWVALLAQDPANTKYVVMQAIGHPVEAVRLAAADELKNRPREDYVPLLLACARFPVEFACSVLACGGMASAHYTLDIQGLEADTQVDHSDSLQVIADFYAPNVFRAHHISDYWDGRPTEDVLGLPQPQDPARPMYPALFAAGAAGRARNMNSLVDQYNTASAEINQRVTQALARATGEDLEANPRVWQTWWKEYLCDNYELESPQDSRDSRGPGDYAMEREAYGRTGGLPQERPVYRYETSSSRYVLPVYPLPEHSTYTYVPKPPPPGSHSCFRGSTLVWTSIGPRPIAEIHPGDRVLSQNVSTGELAYKMVQEVTKRNPTPMVQITVGGEEILSTLGHPFWVNGRRWVMAKHLQTGCALHTISGPRTIDKVEEMPAAKEWYEFSYNLQVGDFHTFFVGENQVLVHHLSMLSILDEGSSLVPGL